jgi:EAL domain-containing protein (putative c-di-GMP-specific phosphodiesterase class I)
VQDLPGDAEDAAIATATLSIARDLGLAVIAEGVETPAQRDFLLTRQCRVMQGYLLSPPCRPAITLLRDQAGQRRPAEAPPPRYSLMPSRSSR